VSRIITLSFGRILNAISAVAMVRLYTEILKPVQVGKLSLLLSLTSLFTFALIAPVSSYVMRRAIDWHAGGLLRHHLKRPLVYAVLAASVAAVGSELFVRIGLLRASHYAGPLVGLAVLGVAVSGVGSQLFNYLDRPYTFVILSCVTSWGAVVLCGVLCSRFSALAETWVFGVAAAQLAGGALMILLIARLDQAGIPKSHLDRPTHGFHFRTVLNYSTPVLLATCLSWVQTDGYRYLFVRITDERTLGLFVAGFAVGVSPLAFVDRLIGDAYLPTLTRDLAFKSREHWPDSWEAYSSSAILPLVLFAVLSCSGTHLLAKLLVSSTYSAFAWIGVWGGLVKSLQMMASLYVGFSYAALETKQLAIPYLIGAAVALVAVPIFARAFTPVVGVAASLACGSLAILISISRSAWKRHQVRFPYNAFYRAGALGVPVAITNIISKVAIQNLTAFAAIVIIGGEVSYIAIVCWLLYPKADSNAFKQPALVSVAGQEAQI
jgi:hypothetical protein